MRKLLAAGLITAGLGAFSVATAGIAAAHDSNHTANCQGYSVSATYYPQGSHTTLTLDGKKIVDTDFGPDFSKSGSWDQTKDHSLEWVVTSSDGQHQYDVDWVVTQAACQHPTTTPAPTTTVPPTTTPPTTVPSTTAPPTTLPPGEGCQDTRGVVGNQTTVPCTVPTVKDTIAPTPPTTDTAITVPAPPPTDEMTVTPDTPNDVAQPTAPPTTTCLPVGEHIGPGQVPCSLPATGSDTGDLVAAAFGAAFCGALLVAITRRRAVS